jgi:hypothetical protein
VQSCPDAIIVVEKPLGSERSWTFPAASVSAVELEVGEMKMS